MPKQLNISDIGVIDLFCGVGGLSHGFLQEGFNVLAGVDTDNTCEYAYKKNNNAEFVSKDVREIKGTDLDRIYEGANSKIKILVGCAPCQPFSSLSYKLKDKDEKKWGLLEEFGRLIEECNPDIVSMENVPQLAQFSQKPILAEFKKVLSKQFATPYCEVVFCPDYGIPQNRKRLVLIASRFGPISLIKPTHGPGRELPYRTVRETIGSLPRIAAGQASESDKLHRARGLTPINLNRLQATKEGKGWKDWPQELLLDCHKKNSGKTYVSVYGRMKWDEPSPTMTTHCTGIGNGRFGHPDQDRAISYREAAMLQTFPQNYEFCEDWSKFNGSSISRHIGNAVPPLLGKALAQSIHLHLLDHYRLH